MKSVKSKLSVAHHKLSLHVVLDTSPQLHRYISYLMLPVILLQKPLKSHLNTFPHV